MKKTDAGSAIEIFAEKVRDLRERFGNERAMLKADLSEDAARFEAASEAVDHAAQTGNWPEYKEAVDRKNEMEMRLSWKRNRLHAMKKDCLISTEERDDLEQMKKAALDEMNAIYEENRSAMGELVRQMILLGHETKARVDALNAAEDDLEYFITHSRRHHATWDSIFFQKDKISGFVQRACPGRQKTDKAYHEDWYLINPFTDEEFKWS